MKLNEKIILRLQEINKESGLTMRQLSLQIAHSASALHQIYNGHVNVLSKPIISLLEMKYGINPEWLETGKGPKASAGQFINDPHELELLQSYRYLSLEKRRISATVLKALVCDEKKENKSKPKKDKKS